MPLKAHTVHDPELLRLIDLFNETLGLCPHSPKMRYHSAPRWTIGKHP